MARELADGAFDGDLIPAPPAEGGAPGGVDGDGSGGPDDDNDGPAPLSARIPAEEASRIADYAVLAENRPEGRDAGGVGQDERGRRGARGRVARGETRR